MSQSSKGTDQLALLLPVPIFPLPELPNLPPYHGKIYNTPTLSCAYGVWANVYLYLCPILVNNIDVCPGSHRLTCFVRAPLVEAWLCLSLAFDGFAFLSIMFVIIRVNRHYGVFPLMRIIQQDGIFYFFVLFSSNLVWLLLLLHARVNDHICWYKFSLTAPCQQPALKFIHNQ